MAAANVLVESLTECGLKAVLGFLLGTMTAKPLRGRGGS